MSGFLCILNSSYGCVEMEMLYGACQINRINWINNTNRINNGSIDLCKLGGRPMLINRINADQYGSIQINSKM